MPESPKTVSKRLDDPGRPELPHTGDEVTLLTTYLDWQRATFAAKVAGRHRRRHRLLTVQAARSSVPSRRC